MAKIRTLGTRELKQVVSLLERFKGDGFDAAVLAQFQALYLPLSVLNHGLPLSWRFLPAIYVAKSDDKVLGLVWLSRDGERSDRWKIDQIIIDPDIYSAYDVGKQLMEYVIHRFGSMGVETFLAYVAPHYTEGLGMLKDCGFRHCTRMHTLALEVQELALKARPLVIEGLREARASDARKLQELHSETLSPEVRVSLRKSPGDFYPTVWQKCLAPWRGRFIKRWVVGHSHRDYLYGSVSFSTQDYKQFELSILVSPAWEEGLEDLILFGLQQVGKNALTPRVTMHLYEFQKHKQEVARAVGFVSTGTTEILVKDYWIPLKDKAGRLRNPVLLFAQEGRTSPA